MNFCPECGTKYEGGGRCRRCGISLDKISDSLEELRLLEDFVFERASGGIRLLSCKDRETDEFFAPSSLVELAPSAFSDCTELVKVDLSKSRITEIPDGCFRNCTSLFEILLPPGLTSVGEEAFSGCGDLFDLSLPEGVERIGERAFLACGDLNDVALPSTLRFVGKEAFLGCESLLSVSISDLAAFCRICFVGMEANPLHPGADLILRDEDVEELVIPDEITRLAPFAFAGCTSLESVHIPATTIIHPLSFAGCELIESITVDPGHYEYTVKNNCILRKRDSALVLAPCDARIPGTVKRVLSGALSPAITQELFTFPEGAVLESGALAFCRSIEELTFSHRNDIGAAPDLKSLFTLSFMLEGTHLHYGDAYDSLRAVTFLSADALGGGFFLNFPSVRRVTLPKELDELPGTLFSPLTLDSLTIPRGIKSILPPIFLTLRGQLTLEAGSRYAIREGCLIDPEKKALLSMLGASAIPTGITCIEAQACRGNNTLTVLRIPEGVTTIKRCAFADCKALRELYLPKSLQLFHASMILGADALSKISFPTTETWSGLPSTGECTCSPLHLGEHNDPFSYFSAKGSRYGSILKGAIPKEKYYLIPEL